MGQAWTVFATYPYIFFFNASTNTFEKHCSSNPFLHFKEVDTETRRCIACLRDTGSPGQQQRFLSLDSKSLVDYMLHAPTQ